MLPNVNLIKVIQVLRELPPSLDYKHRRRSDWCVYAEVEGDETFRVCFWYLGGVPTWFCQKNLGDSLRRKILQKFREVRFSDYGGETIDFCAEDFACFEKKPMTFPHAEEFYLQKVDDFKEFIGIELKKWVCLSVPFEEKDAASAKGAKWLASKKSWVVEEAHSAEFSRWLKNDAETFSARIW